MSGEGGSAGEASTTGLSGEGWSALWLRISDRVEALATECARLEAVNKIQHEFWEARDNILQNRLHEMESSRAAWEAAYAEVLAGDNGGQKLAGKKRPYSQLRASDLEDSKTSKALLSLENSELKIQLKELRSCVELSQNTADHENTAKDLIEELRTLKQAYETMKSDKDKEVSALLARKEFVVNEFTTMQKDVSVLFENKNMELAQATEAARKLQQTVDELQVSAQKKEDENGRLQGEAVEAQNKILVLEVKLQDMHSLANERDEEIQNLKIWASADLVSDEVTNPAPGDKTALVPSGPFAEALSMLYEVEKHVADRKITGIEALNMLYEVEKHVATVNNRREHELICKYWKVKTKYEALKGELQRVKAAAVDPAEVQSLKEQLAKAQEEVSTLRESLKNSVPLPELTAKLGERDVQHEQATRDLRVQAHRAEGLQEEVDRLQEARQQENEGHLRRLSEIIEEHKKLAEDYQRQSSVLVAKQKRLVDGVMV